ncbi:MAG: TolB family protein [Gemmatimonadales bacterium]
MRETKPGGHRRVRCGSGIGLWTLLLAMGIPGGLVAQRPTPPFFQSLTWSADGKSVIAAGVLSSWEKGYALYAIPVDGGPPRTLETGEGEAPLFPAVAADGKRVAYGNKTAEGHGIWILNVESGALKRVVLTDHAGGPSWSPSGAQLAYHATVDSLRQIMVVSLDGGSPRQISPSQGNNWNPQWSPDGTWIAYYSDRRGAGAHDTIYVVRPDGSDEGKVTGGVFPTWTTDGRLLFSDRGGDGAALFIVNRDGSNRRRLIPNAFFGAMSPDGEWVAAITFEGPRTGRHYRIELLRPDGSGRRVLFQ